MIHKMPELPYAQHALEPIMSAETLSFHFGKHLQTYLDNVNKLIVGTPYAEMPLKEIIAKASGPIYNNAAQAWNHIMFFKQLTPQPVAMSSTICQAITSRFDSIDNFRKQFTEAAVGLFGSGWVWLALDERHELQLLALPNAGNPITHNMRPLFCIDVWEHAYYIDYRNRRAEYVEKFWNLIDWQKVERRMSLDDSPLFY